MDTTSIIAIVVAVALIYFFVKFVVNPIIKAILGVIVFLIIIYLLQKYLGFDVGQIFSPFGISLNLSKWGINLDWISGFANHYIDQAKTFLNFSNK